jgi:plastocyanin
VGATTWRRLASAGMLLAGLALSLGCCGSSSAAANAVEMGVADFQQRAVTIRAGQAVHFDDPANGGSTHIICIGKGQQCVPQTGAPAELNTASGITFNPGDPPKDIVFATPGTYTVVCTIHPAMIITITVQ